MMVLVAARDRRINDRDARTAHFPPHFRPRRSLSDRRRSVFILGLTGRTPDDGIRPKHSHTTRKRNSRLGYHSPRQSQTAIRMGQSALCAIERPTFSLLGWAMETKPENLLTSEVADSGMFEQLDFIYRPSRDVAADVEY
jgi:hypothetical protein